MTVEAVSPSNRPTAHTVVLLGAAFSANKGAAAMLHAVLDRLPEHLGPCHFRVLTLYPEVDRKAAAGREDVEIVPATPAGLALSLLLAVPLAVLRAARLSALARRLTPTPALRALATADSAVDVAGISFVDGRGILLLAYNVCITGLPVLMGCPTVKAAQALGPFRQPANRLAARALLPHLRAVCARGTTTREHLEDLGLSNIVDASDLAFLLSQPEEAVERANELVVRNERPLVGINPSQVVANYASAVGIDYIGALTDFIRWLHRQGWQVCLFPHALQPGKPASRMNDLPLCRQVHERVADVATLVDADLDPLALRAMVDRCDVLATSRFHAMVSALATATPVLVVGWSHKYVELLADFGLQGHVLAYDHVDADGLREAFGKLTAQQDDVAEEIKRVLPEVAVRARRNLEVIAAASRRTS